MSTSLDFFRALAGACAAMAILIATELALMTAAATVFAALGGVTITADSLLSPLRWSAVLAILALLLSSLAAPETRGYVFRTVPAQLLRRTLPIQLIGVGVVELLLLATGHL